MNSLAYTLTITSQWRNTERAKSIETGMERIENGMDQMEKWKEKKKKMANGEESKGNNRAAAAATTKLRQKLADTKGSRAED